MSVSNHPNFKHFISGMERVEGEVKKGSWDNREDALAEKIQELLTHLPIPKENFEPAAIGALKTTIKNMKAALKHVKNHTPKLKDTINALSSSKLAVEGKAHEEIDGKLKHLPCNNANDIKASLAIFREHLQKDPAALAEWIEFNQLPLSKLKLTQEELKTVLPHATYLSIGTHDIPADELTAVFKKCHKLKTLILEHDEIRVLPHLPHSLQKLKVQGDNLQEITTLNEGLKSFDCSNNPELKKFQEALPKSLKEFIIIDSPKVTEIPKLNDGLKLFDCSLSLNIELPYQLNEKLKHFKCRGLEIACLPTFSEALETLDMSECPNLTFLSTFPKKSVDCSKCINLEHFHGEIPDSLEKIYIGWSTKAKLPKNLANAQVVK